MHTVIFMDFSKLEFKKNKNFLKVQILNKIISEQRKGLGNKSVSQMESAVLSALCFAKSASPTASIFAVN